MYWATRISNIGMQMAVPPLLGWWLDSLWGTAPGLLIAGAVLGFVSGMWSIFQLADRFSRTGQTPPPRSQDVSPRRSSDETTRGNRQDDRQGQMDP